MIPEGLEIARKPRSEASSEVNGATNGIPIRTNGDAVKRKRSIDDAMAAQQANKKGKMNGELSSDKEELLIVDDSGDGAILID